MAEYFIEYAALALVSVLAFSSPFIARKLKTPVVVTELAFGIT